MKLLKKFVKLSGAGPSLEQLPLPSPLFFVGRDEGPVVIFAEGHSVLPLFTSERVAMEFYEQHIPKTVEGGPDDGAKKESRVGLLYSVFDLAMIFGQAEESELAIKMMTVNPPGEGVPFTMTETHAFFRYALARAEERYWS